MATQEQNLAELKELNLQLGLPEDDGIPLTYDQKLQELRALDEELARTPESFEEYVERRKVEDARSLGDKSSAFLDSFMVGGKALAQEGAGAIGELFRGDVGSDELGGVFQVGIEDFGRFAKTIGGSIMDNVYSDEKEMQREYQRYKDNFLYNQEVRPAMLNTFDEEGRDFVSFGANFVDPSLLVPVAGLIARGGALGAKTIAKGASAVSKGAKAGAFAARSPRLVQLSRAMANTSRGADMVAKGGIKVASGLDKVSKVASIPSELFAKGTRGVLKGTAKAGQAAAGAIGRAGNITSKVAGAPRNLITKVASSAVDPKVAGSGILGAQLVGSMSGAVPGLGLLTATEALGYIANKTGRGMERTLSALASSGSQKRFLQRLATSADSKLVRKSALLAHRYGGTRLGDTAFNMLANSATVGTLNAALAYAAGEGPEGIGAAAGSGALIGGALPFGQSGMRGGKTQKARDEKSINNYLDAKLEQEQRKQFVKLSPVAKLAFATVEEAGIKAPKIEFLDGKTYLELLRQNDPNLRSAPDADLDMDSNVITVNQDGNFAKSSEFAMEILLHELGHGFIKQAIKDDPFFASKILKEYQPKKGEESFEFAFTSDSAGSPIDSIQVNTKAKQIAEMYDGIQSGIGIGRDANALAQEIGAEQFAMMMVDNGGNIFKTIEPSLRHKLLESTRKVLGVLGLVDQQTGNPLSISILGKGVEAKNPILQRSKTIRNLYKNYVEQKEKALVDKIDLAENPMSLKLDKGENAQQAVQRLFSSKGLSLKEAGAFRIKNRQIKRKLIEIRNRLFEKPEGEMRAETNEKGKPVYIVGKKLTDELKAIFTRNDPFGNINTLINTATEAIMQKAQMTMLYRAGKPSKYSDNELRPRVIAPVRYKVTGLANSAKSFASLKLDAFDEAYLRNNAEVLVAEGLAKDPNKLVELARQVARDAMNDPEGRINPEGKYENEIVTALFGQTESAPQIRNPQIRRLLEEGRLKDSYRTYDIDGLAGLVPTGKSGISFEWHNVKNNYLPTDQTLFMPRQSKNFDKKVALRTNESLIDLVDNIAREEGVSRNDVLNRILQEKLDPETKIELPENVPADPSPIAEEIPPKNVTPKVESRTPSIPWSKGSDPSLNWLRNSPDKKLFMPAQTVEQRKANKYGQKFKQATESDKIILSQARREWMEEGYSSENFQDWMHSGFEEPALAVKKNDQFIPIKLYYGGPLGVSKRPGFNAAAPLEAFAKSEFAEGVTKKAESQYSSDDTIFLTTDKKKAKIEQEKTVPGVKPLEFASNASYIFDPLNSEHISMLSDSIRAIEPDSPELLNVDQLFQAGDDILAYQDLLKRAGWQGVRVMSEKGDGVAIFGTKNLKLISDQSGEGKFLTKDRAYGKVSGLFGKELPSSRMSAMGQSERGRDVRFMPQMELNLEDGKTNPISADNIGKDISKPISFWDIFNIDKNGKNVYSKVAKVLINTGDEYMDWQTASDYGPELGLNVKKLRQEMRLAQKRNNASKKYFLPSLPTYKKDGKTFKVPLPQTSPEAPRAYHGSEKKYDFPNEEYLGSYTQNLGFIGMGYYGHSKRVDAEMYAVSGSKSLYSFEMLPEGQTLNSHLLVIEQHPSIQKNLKKLFDTKVSGTGQKLKDLWAKFYTENPTRYADEMVRNATSGRTLKEASEFGSQINPDIDKNIGNQIYMGLVNLYSKNPAQQVGYLEANPDIFSAASTVNKMLANNNIKGAISPTQEQPKGRFDDPLDIDEISPEVVIFDFNEIRDFRNVESKLFMPASEAGAGERNILFMPKSNAVMAKAGDIVKLPEESLRLFLPASPKVNLGDYADRKIFALTTDRLGIGQMATGPKGKKKPIEKDAQGGRGFTQIYNGGGWAFSTKDAADRFVTRVKEVAGKDNSALVGLTVLADINHLKSQYGQLAYANALRAAIETGVITQRKANEHINSIIQRILESKSAKSPKGDQRKILENIKSFADYEKAVKNKKINFALADWFFARKKGKASQATLPIGKDEALELGLDLDSIAKDIADPELAELEGFGQVVGLLEIFKDQQPVKSDFHYSYPWTVEGKKIGFLKEFMDVGELASTPKIRDKFGSVSAQPLQTVMPEFDQLKSMQFMPSDSKAPTRQPANRITRQAPAMLGNRFMAPAASAGAKLSERFR